MREPRFVACPFGVFELRWRRKPILHEPQGTTSKHDYRTDEVLNYARWPEDGWRVVTREEAEKITAEQIAAVFGD
jgi:hypothetical protein